MKTVTEIMPIEILTTPLRQYAKLDFYDLHDLTLFPQPAFVEAEFFGISFYYYEYNTQLREALDRLCKTYNIHIRYKHTACPRFHEERWQQTNNIKAALDTSKDL